MKERGRDVRQYPMQHVQHVRQHLMTQLELDQIGLAHAQAVFAEQMAFAKSITGREPTYRRFGQGMCRPGWTGDMWKRGKRP